MAAQPVSAGFFNDFIGNVVSAFQGEGGDDAPPVDDGGGEVTCESFVDDAGCEVYIDCEIQ